jgi:hypothetical protein
MPIFPTIKLNIERWKYNPTFELYVSNMGHVKNKSKADVAPKVTQNGYVVVYVGGSSPHWMLLHRLVMLTWKPTPEAEGLTVDHLDHNKRNNMLSNLEWATQEENARRAAEDFVSGKLNGNEITVRKKREEKKSNPINTPTKLGDKRKTSPEDILFFHVTCNLKQRRYDFSIKADLSDFEKKTAPFVGKINNFTREGFQAVLEMMLNGHNVNGIKKWCKIKVRAVYSDGRYKNGNACNLQNCSTIFIEKRKKL